MRKISILASLVLVLMFSLQSRFEPILHALEDAIQGKVISEEEEEGGIALKDRMDLAWEQEVELTKDPALGYVPRERLWQAWQYQQMLLGNGSHGKAALSGVTWNERGPNNCAGRTRCVLIDANDPNKKTLWAGSVGGGLWKTTDITLASPNWTPINDLFQNLAITHIDQAPTNPAIMYFCTGEGNNNSDAIRGMGVWKSTNGGSTWTQLTATNTSSYNYCQKVVSLGGGDTVLVLTKTGLYRSVNGGTSFSQVLAAGVSGSIGSIAYDLEVMKNGTLYVTMSDGSSNGGTIHKSYNRGQTWTAPLTLPSYVNKDEMEIAVSANDTNIIYALVESSSRIQAIIRSTNAGLSFDTTASHPIDADGGVSTSTYPKDFSRGQAWYDLSLAVDPNNPAVVVVGGVDLFKTTNSGSSWTQIAHWYGGFGFQEVHADQHYVIFQSGNSDVVYFSNDGGVYRSSNFTNASPVIESKGNNYNSIQFYACDIHPTASANQYVAGAQDNGSHAFNTGGVNSTVEVTGGDGAFCHIDQNQPQYWFTSYVYTSYYRSSNTGASFSNVLNTSQNIGNFINPSDYDDVNNKMYLGGNNGFFVRWTNPQTGSSIEFDTVSVFNNGKITHVKVSPNVGNRVYFGLNNGRIVRVDNAHIQAGTDSCLNRLAGMPTGSVSCIEVETGNENHIIATYSNFGVNSVWESKDGGATWASIEGNLPDMPVRWALLNPNKNWQLMLATELGVWTTDSIRGTTTNYGPSNSGFANVRTDMLKMRSSDNQVIAATHGRGLFSSNIFSPPFADFTVNKRLGYVSAFFNFTSTSNGANSYYWDFGDGTNSTAQNPVKQYMASGTYNVSLTINGGAYSKTQTAYIQVLPYRPVPYLAAAGGDFESNAGDFGAELISGVGFVRGNATTTGKNGTYSGSNAWVTGLTGNYADNNQAYLYSPCFNCTAAGTYTLKFYVKNKFEVNYDGYIVEYSTNLGVSWNALGTAVATGWYDFANAAGGTAFPAGQAFFSATNSAYTLKQYNISSLAGNPKVSFRIAFKSDAGVTDVGMALDNFEVTGPSNPSLPVTYLMLEAKRQENGNVNVIWQTSSEKNNKGYSIERSTDGVQFKEIGYVKGAGNSNQILSYSFKDLEAPRDWLYYRIKQTDLDGQFTYSHIVRADAISSEEKLANLTYLNNGEGIRIENIREGNQIQIIARNGQLVFEKNLKQQLEMIDLGELPAGIYIVRFNGREGQVQTEKLLWMK